MIKTDNVMQMFAAPVDTPPPEVDITHNTVKIPLLGRIHLVQDPQGQMYVAAVLAYWMFGTFSTIFIILHPAHADGNIQLIFVYGFYAVSGLCLMSLIRASLFNPGRIPSYDFNKNKEKGWNLCSRCNCMRPPRAHHCRRCGQCVMRMDHHCPWINNCVGEDNHFAFIQLLVYAFLMGVYAFVLTMLYFWVFPKCVNCNTEALYIKHSLWFMYINFLLSINIMFVMATMTIQQHAQLVVNRTTLENMMKPVHNINELSFRRSYVAYRDLCGRGSPIFWWCPIGRRRPILPLGDLESV